LPATQQTSNEPLADTLRATINIIDTVGVTKPQPPIVSAPKPIPPTPDGSTTKADDSKPAESKPEEKKDNIVSNKDAAFKKDEPVKKLYCN
jgi:hypothetical protein